MTEAGGARERVAVICVRRQPGMRLATAQSWNSKTVLHLPVVNRFHPACPGRSLHAVGRADDHGQANRHDRVRQGPAAAVCPDLRGLPGLWRSEEHTSELQSLMRI